MKISWFHGKSGLWTGKFFYEITTWIDFTKFSSNCFMLCTFFSGHPAGAPGSFLAAAAAQHSAMGLGPMPISGPSNAGAPKSLTAQPGVAPPAFRYT